MHAFKITWNTNNPFCYAVVFAEQNSSMILKYLQNFLCERLVKCYFYIYKTGHLSSTAGIP